MPDMFDDLLQQSTINFDKIITLGPCSMRLKSNVADFPGHAYFSPHCQRAPKVDEEVDFELYCISLQLSGITPDDIKPFMDHTCRSGQFADGYYATDHFGAPVYIVTRGRSCYLFGEYLEKVMWPYFVKYFLQLYATEHGYLFLKAAAISINGKGILLLGRGGSGKTVFLSQLCLNGATFISNSHVLVRSNKLYGVGSAMRVRPQPANDDLLRSSLGLQGLRSGEVIIDPYDTFTVTSEPVPFSAVCVIRFAGTTNRDIAPLTVQQAHAYAEQFSFGLNVYRLEEDLLDFLKDDITRYGVHYIAMREKLQSLIKSGQRYYMTGNILDPVYRKTVFSTLG